MSFFFFFGKLFLLREGKFAFSTVPSPTHVIPLYMKLEMLHCSFTKLCLTLHDLMNMSVPGFLVCHCLSEFAQTHAHWVSDAIQPSHPLSPPSLPALNLSQHKSFFQWVSSSHQVARVLELQLQHQPFQWIFRVDFFRIDWFDLLAVQGNLKSLPQHCNWKASILQLPTFFIVHLSHPYITTRKIIALTVWIFVGKVMSLLIFIL